MPRQSSNLTGTQFAIPLPNGEFLFGMVTLDIAAVKAGGLLPANSSLMSLGFALLIEVYSDPQPSMTFKKSSQLINGVYVNRNSWAKWPLLGRAQVNPREVAFPETLVGNLNDIGQVAFCSGEIRVGLPFSLDILEKHVKVHMSVHPTSSVILASLRALSRLSEISENEQYESLALTRSDLRWSSHREMVYQHLPTDMNKCYYEQQRSLGYDLNRLYS